MRGVHSWSLQRALVVRGKVPAAGPSTIHTRSPVYKSGMKAHLDTFAAAEWLGLKEATLRDWRCAQKGPPYIEISSRCIRYALEDLVKWRNERRHTPSVANYPEVKT
jgi:hypothetical protein